MSYFKAKDIAKIKDKLENYVDDLGLPAVLELLAAIASEKAVHIEESFGENDDTGIDWSQAGEDIVGLADKKWWGRLEY